MIAPRLTAWLTAVALSSAVSSALAPGDEGARPQAAGAGAAASGAPAAVPTAAPAAEAPIPLRFEGLLPGSVSPELCGKFRVELRIYKSPQGGEPIWREDLEVEVERGRMDVLLGLKNPIPLDVHKDTFKFLGASVNRQREVYPRYAIVNVVYASAKEALLGIAAEKGKPAAARSPGDAVAGSRYARPAATVEKVTHAASSWIDALRAARASGGDLPDYEDWYRALEARETTEVGEMTGHYEWVLPWVYDPASHGRYHAYFRGRFQGCDYMDLSPSNKYPYRVARAAPSVKAPPDKAPAAAEEDGKAAHE